MAILTVKPGTQPPILHMAAVLSVVAAEFPALDELVITAGINGQHGQNSLHYALRALDVRTKTIPTLADKQRLRQRVAEELGPGYDVLLEDLWEENEHLHLEFDP